MGVARKCEECHQPLAIGHSEFCPTTPIYASMCSKVSPVMISGAIRSARLGRPTGRIVNV